MSIARYFNVRLRRRILAGEEPGWLLRHPRRSYIVAATLSMPEWVDRSALRSLRNEAKWKTIIYGERYVLDHIIPVTHPLVCGLTVPWNLRVVTYQHNARKSNKLYDPPEQLDLLSNPEQLRFL